MIKLTFFTICICICFFVLQSLGLNLDRDDASEVNAIVGENSTLLCQATDERVWWSKNGKNITKTDKKYSWNTTINEQFENEIDLISEKRAKPTYSHTLTINNVNLKDSGNFTCHFPSENENITENSFFVQSVMKPVIVKSSAKEIRIRDGTSQSVTLFCVVQVYPIKFFNNSIKWEKETVDTVENKDSTDSSQINADINNRTVFSYLNDTHVNVSITFDSITKKHNGTYTCSVAQSMYLTEELPKVETKSNILVLAVPIAMISYVKAVGASKIYMNWTVNDGNDPVSKFFIQQKKGDDSSFIYYKEPIGGKNTSFVMRGFDKSTRYMFKLSAQNSIGSGPITESDWVETLAEDPVFVPKIEVKGNSHSTITIGWQPPPPELLDFIHYYELVVYHAENDSVVEEAIHPQNSRNLPYMFDNLKTATEYTFKVRACNELTRECGAWSETVNGTTMDGQASEPVNLEINCFHSNVSRVNSVSVEWGPPKNPNGKIISYQIVLKGISTFRTDAGSIRNETFGPKTKSVDGNSVKTFYENVPPNTNYSISVAGVTRSKRIGDQSTKTCTMPASVPDNVARVLWGKVQNEDNNWIFKVFLPRISERNGPICCYRVYMIRMTPSNPHLKNSPEDYDIVTYEEAHNNSQGGAYIAEIIPTNNFQSEILLGDNKKSQFSKNQNFNGNEMCNVCLKDIYRKHPVKIVRTEPPVTEDYDDLPEDSTTVKPAPTTAPVTEKPLRRRRRRQEFKSPDNQITPTSLSIYDSLSLSLQNKNEFLEILDGQLDINSNYSGFVEIVVENSQDQLLSVYSEYFHVISPKADPIPEDNSQTNFILNVITHFLAALIVFVLFLICILCLLHRYQKKNVAQGNEVVSLTDSLRALCHGRPNHHQHRSLVGNITKPPDMPPIPRESLPQAWTERHKDSDYGFQHEFELLPDRFNDRTSKNTDSKDNAFKNRYPDIKSYDQTRVKLANLNGLAGSDYINANFVIGYKERKKFICAQGPMDSTVNDFWRMIWEQHLEIIVMLTNLEEYNKTKCAKYWPERVSDIVQFGDIKVSFENEQRYSDYICRNLKIIKRQITSEDTVEDVSRHITQYHYLAWKDFMAPEHPHGIIKFIKTINSVYSVQRGPLLIHCSAGVGRTGTLVALDSLMQQLNEEGQVSIFNTVCDLRHQRNYLVQSLKQYIFLYKALVDVGIFSDTELQLKGLKETVEQLKQRASDSKEQCKLEREYEKIKGYQDEIRKTCAVGNGDENRPKNRSEDVIPYDRNRVILTPIPGRDHSTYINASFIEGYENQESFIIAQDPIDGVTVSDFWRLISEQSITTIVMMSEIGDTKCPRYWADDEAQFDHILVKYIQSESCPYYTKREFTVTNCKIDDQINVTQFQYHGWPTVDGEVPEVTRGMLEIVHQAQTHIESKDDGDNQVRPIVVHCSKGTDRSSIFVAMSILVQQLRLEKKVDICTVVRKLRSQRPQMIDSYAQYEFLHRAIVNYADLHKQSLDSPTNC